jgi:hypothetical protein
MKQRLQRLCASQARSHLMVPVLLAFVMPGWPAHPLGRWAFGLFAAVMAQTSVYWGLKARSLARRTPLPAWFDPVFAWLRWTNHLAAAALATALALSGPHVGGRERSLCLFFLLFAVVESINAFEWQLAHFNRRDVAHLRATRRLRRSALWRDLHPD